MTTKVVFKILREVLYGATWSHLPKSIYPEEQIRTFWKTGPHEPTIQTAATSLHAESLDVHAHESRCRTELILDVHILILFWHHFAFGAVFYHDFNEELEYQESPPKHTLILTRAGVPDIIEEAQLGLLFQHFILSHLNHQGQHFVYFNDPAQQPLYWFPHNQPLNFPFQMELLQLYKAMCEVRLLNCFYSQIAGAVEAWIESVNTPTGIPDTCSFVHDRFHFFEFHMNLGRLITSSEAIVPISTVM
ncbi:hypothetical protein L218DRAFT_949575 [Marasmius fiardii PR-910]|nr:hypothetical protein L218DRAFT_949575 [Marasmius fiardii PR-910]